MTIDDYILSHISPEHPYLYRLYRATNTQLLRPRMASGHLQGQLLKMLCQMIQPRHVLEIGTFSGYSALAMASGMPVDGKIYTFEINDEQEDFTRPWLENSPWADRIEMIIGDVSQLLPELVQKIKNKRLPEKLEHSEQLEQSKQLFDLVFMDANKRDYCSYYELVMPYLRPGGWIIADNTLWDGHVIDPTHQHDAQTRGILAFNDLVRSEAEAGTIELNLLPIRDGLTLIRKKI